MERLIIITENPLVSNLIDFPVNYINYHNQFSSRVNMNFNA